MEQKKSNGLGTRRVKPALGRLRKKRGMGSPLLQQQKKQPKQRKQQKTIREVFGERYPDEVGFIGALRPTAPVAEIWAVAVVLHRARCALGACGVVASVVLSGT